MRLAVTCVCVLCVRAAAAAMAAVEDVDGDLANDLEVDESQVSVRVCDEGGVSVK